MDYLKIVFGILNFLVCIDYVRLLSMLTESRATVLHTGQSVILECQFFTEFFSLFDNPVLWTKYQLHEETALNIMGNIIEPFVNTGRFHVTFDRRHPRYTQKLKIDDLIPEDSGNYTCEIRGTGSTILGTVTHNVYVRAPVQSIFISDQINPEEWHPKNTRKNRVLEFREDALSPLRCASVGGFPPPEMEIYLAGRPITEQFSLRHSTELIGDHGMRRILFRTERWSYNFRALAQDDGQNINCIVTVQGLGSNTSSVKIHVQYAPIITCEPAAARLGETNVYLRCRVKARPGLNKLHWSTNNGTKVGRGGKAGNEYNIMTAIRGEEMETKLIIPLAKEDAFRIYSVVAENSIAKTTQEVELQQKYQHPTKSSPLEIVDSGRKQSSSSHGRRSEKGEYNYHSTTCRAKASAQLVLCAILLSAVFVHR